MKFSDFEIFEDDDKIKFRQKGKTVAYINKGLLSPLISSLDLDKPFPKKSKVAEPTDDEPEAGDSEIEVKAYQMSKAYAKAKAKFFGAKITKFVTPKQRDFQHFIEAAKLAGRHGATAATYIKAQIAGLDFLQQGKGIFPKPNHLATEQAETRLLEYMQAEKRETNPDTPITAEDRRLPLDDNRRYQTRLRMIDWGQADEADAKFVAALQKLHLGKVQKSVTRYLEQF